MAEIGSYSPAFFKMTVNVDGDIDLNLMSPKEFSVFFHEYIHFIQDFTTAAGCRRIYVYGEYLRQSVTQTTNGANNTFQVPIIIQDYVNNVMPNMKLMDNLDGDRGDVEIKSINDVMLFPESIDDKDGGMVEYQMLTLDINQGDYLSVGTYAIKESMAYLVEKLCCSDYLRSPDFPYNIVRIISDFLLGDGALSDIVLLALCDISLLTSNPGLTFYRLLQSIKNGYIKAEEPEKLYDYFYNCSSKVYNTGQQVFSIADYLINAKFALETLKMYYAVEKLQDLNQWIDDAFSLGACFRIHRPYFFLEMARGKKDKDNEILQFFARNIGAPLMENKQGKMYKLKMSGAEPPTEYLYILEQIYHLFKFGTKACKLEKWCAQNPGTPKANYDERCKCAPWSRCHDKNLCPYALFWHHRNLSNFTPEFV